MGVLFCYNLDAVVYDKPYHLTSVCTRSILPLILLLLLALCANLTKNLTQTPALVARIAKKCGKSGQVQLYWSGTVGRPVDAAVQTQTDGMDAVNHCRLCRPRSPGLAGRTPDCGRGAARRPATGSVSANCNCSSSQRGNFLAWIHLGLDSWL